MRRPAPVAPAPPPYLLQTENIHLAQCERCGVVVDARRLRRGRTIVVDAVPTEDPAWEAAEYLRRLSASATTRAAKTRRPRDRTRARALRKEWLDARDRTRREGGQLAHSGCGGRLQLFENRRVAS